MLTRITLAVVMIVAVSTASATHNRDNGFTFKLAQYCWPQDEVPGEPGIYC